MRLRFPLAVTAVAALAAVAAGSAFGHARLFPATAFDQAQLFTLNVPNEKEDAKTTKVVLHVPDGFGIRLFEPAEGWTRTQEVTGSGEDEHITTVTWTSTGDGTSEGGLFLFTAGADSADTYTFEVEQTYSDGEVVDWAGPEDSDEPAPTVDVVSSLGGSDDDSTDWLTIVALVVGGVGVVLGAVALARGSARTVA
jgi:uncharacterized protein YcnI